MTDYRAVRVAAGVSQIRVSVDSDTSPPTVRLFEEAGPSAIVSAEKRRALIGVYERLAAIAASRNGGRAA